MNGGVGEDGTNPIHALSYTAVLLHAGEVLCRAKPGRKETTNQIDALRLRVCSYEFFLVITKLVAAILIW